MASVMKDMSLDMKDRVCNHYKRRASIVAPCCKKRYDCRFCHNEAEWHQVPRKSIDTVVCKICSTVQPFGRNCTNCEVKFGKYICMICKLFDDEEKRQFHCDKCEICRVGGKENYFHCDKCNYCLPKSLLDHTCIENASKTDCPLCLEDIHTSRDPARILKCRHLINMSCYDNMVKEKRTACLVCGNDEQTGRGGNATAFLPPINNLKL